MLFLYKHFVLGFERVQEDFWARHHSKLEDGMQKYHNRLCALSREQKHPFIQKLVEKASSETDDEKRQSMFQFRNAIAFVTVHFLVGCNQGLKKVLIGLRG